MPARKKDRPNSRIIIEGIVKSNPEYTLWKYHNDPKWREGHLKATSNWARTHQKESSWRTLRYYYRIRSEIFNLLGNRCNNSECPVPPEKMDFRCLQIDHIHGGGCSSRNNKINPSRYSFYKQILKEIKAGSKDYALLCVYCNWRKRYLNKELYRKYPEVEKQ